MYYFILFCTVLYCWLAPKCLASFIFQNYCEIIVKLLLKSYDVSRCNVEQELLKDQLKKMLRKALRWKIQNMKLNLRTKWNYCWNPAMWQAWRKVWEVKEILDDAKKSLMNKIDQQEKSKSSRQNKPDAVDKTQPLEGCFRNVKRFLWSLRTRRTPQRSA